MQVLQRIGFQLLINHYNTGANCVVPSCFR